MTGSYRLGECIAGNQYLIKDGYDNDELWVKNRDGQKIKIFSGQIYSIKVSPDERFIAINIGGTYLKILNVKTGAIDTYAHNEVSFDELGETTELIGWSADSQYLWGGTSLMTIPDFFRINAESNKVNKFQQFTHPIYLNDYSLNPNSGVLAYSYIIGAESGYINNFINPLIQLSVYSFFNSWEIGIAKAKEKKFNPAWYDNLSFGYDNPDGRNRLKYILPIDFVLDKQTLEKLTLSIENWDLYQEVAETWEKNFACYECTANKEYLDFNSKAKEGSVKKLMLNGELPLYITPNYLNWSNKKFLSFSNDPTAVCCIGNSPLKAYPDRLLWREGCGGAAPDENTPEYDNFQKCLLAESVLNNYFTKHY